MASWVFNVTALATLVKEIDPITMTSVRILTAGIMVLVISKIIGIIRLPTKAEWKTIGLITIFNVVLHHSLLAIGLTKTAGVNGGIILGAAPLVTRVLSVLFLHYRVSNIRVIGFLLGFVGILITSIAGTDGIAPVSTADLFIFLCIIALAI